MGNLIGGKDDKMSYKFKITRGNAILNFSEEYCQSRCELIESESFARVLKGYVHDIKRKKTTAYEYLREVQKESIDIVEDLRTVFRLLLVMDPKELASIYPKFAPYFRDMDEFTQVIENNAPLPIHKPRIIDVINVIKVNDEPTLARAFLPRN